MKDGLEWVLKKRQNEEKMSRKKSWIERGKSGHGPGLLELPCVYLKKVDTSDGNQFARKLKKNLTFEYKLSKGMSHSCHGN